MDNNKSANDDYGGVFIDADTTIKLTAGLVISDKVAVIAVFPVVMPVTTPSADIVATEVSELFILPGLSCSDCGYRKMYPLQCIAGKPL